MVSPCRHSSQDFYLRHFFRYRAEIVAIQVNETMPHELLFDVYFLDYGDNQFIGRKDILELRADFLGLRFQAIECFLAHIHPTNERSQLDEWDEKAVEKFEEMVQAARWKKLISKVVTYKERRSFAFQRQSMKRESSPIPGVELYDPEVNPDKSIAHELVRLGYAELSDNFGDLSRSAILNSNKSDGAEIVIETVKEKSPDKEKSPLKENKSTVVEDQQTNPVNEEKPQLPSINAEPTNENQNNSSAKTNGTPKEPVTNLLKAQKPSKGNKKQRTSDFLKNEKQASPKKSDNDWNAMLED